MKKLIEKRLKVTRVKDLLTGKFDISREGFKHVKSIAIFSCQSPTSAKIKVDGEPDALDFEVYLEKYKHTTLQDWNEESMQKARKILRNYRFRIVDGLYEGHEKSFIVFDMERKHVEDFNKRFYQQAYMFINLVDKIDPDVGSGKTFGIDANGNSVRPLTRRGTGNEAAKQVAYMETWERINEVYNEKGPNDNNGYKLMETSFGITLDTSFMKDPSHPSKEDLYKYQTRVSKDLGFSALYKKYGANPDDYEGAPLNLQAKGTFTDSDFEDVYNSSH